MAGCFGSHPEDKARECELHAFLANNDNTLEDEIKARTELIFNDLHEFEEFMFDGHEAARLITRELLMALFNSRYKSNDYAEVVSLIALANCNDALDAKIRQVTENGSWL